MERISVSTELKFRALLARSDEVRENGGQAEVSTSKWYEEKPPLDQVARRAKGLGCDVVSIETVVITIETYAVED